MGHANSCATDPPPCKVRVFVAQLLASRGSNRETPVKKCSVMELDSGILCSGDVTDECLRNWLLGELEQEQEPKFWRSLLMDP
jgi:hypothetical protein